jgi:competence protein ComEC
VRGLTDLSRLIEGQRGYLFPWVPVMLGTGIGIWFSLNVEPVLSDYLLAAGAALACLVLALRHKVGLGPPLLAVALVLTGGLAAGLRAHLVQGPVLAFRYYGPIEGRLLDIDRSASDHVRLTLDRLALQRVPPWRTPGSVRLTLHLDGQNLPEPGARIRVTGHLSPPEGPVEPGGFDFRRFAYFKGLGAVGYSRFAVEQVAPPPSGAALYFQRLRMRLSAAIQARIAGQPGAFAAAMLTGDRSPLTVATSRDLRASNLAHLLSISGLHMGLVCGSIFGGLRLAFAAVPALALRVSTRKLAAVGAILAGLFYDLLSGRQVPAERAYVMVAVMFAAVLVDRRAISLRSVAMAATFILLTRPESVSEAGFQMSFAATVALVAAFTGLRALGPLPLPRWPVPAAVTVISSLVAGLATAPFAAASFNRIASYGLAANLATVPLMGVTVMPLGVVALLLGPFGLEWLPLWLMDWPLRWILWVAHLAETTPGALRAVPTPPDAVIPLLSLGGLFVAIWRGGLRARALGGLPVMAAFALWAAADRPMLLVSPDGALMGLQTPYGRALSKPKGQGFAADSWLANDGDLTEQQQAALRGGFRGEKGSLLAPLPGYPVLQLAGKGAAGRLRPDCAGARLVIVTEEVVAEDAACEVYDKVRLARSGALAIVARNGKPVLVTAAAVAGQRFWTMPPGSDRRKHPGNWPGLLAAAGAAILPDAWGAARQ